MEKSRTLFLYVLLTLMAVIVSGCGGGSDSSPSTPESYTYATTSSKGDYSEWTLSGSALTAMLNVVSDTGAIDYTFDITATCGSADSFGVRSCTIDTSSCSVGVSTCPSDPTGNFDMMEVPGVALFINSGSGTSAQLHVGFAKDSSACTQDVSGDYTMIHTGLGSYENFGMYRSDANFLNILHSDFGFESTDSNVTPSVVYTTDGGTGSGAATLTDDGCVDGVRTRSVGGDTIRSVMTASGLFVLDLPSGQGGLISFKTSNAATLADFAGKSFGGISFPDDGDPAPINAMFSSVTGSKVNITATIDTTTSSALDIMPLSATSTDTAPGYPDFSAAVADYSTHSLLAADYAVPTDIPGLFKLDGSDSTGDEGRVVIAAMKFSSKVIAVGMVYNWRTTFETNPATGTNFTSDGLYNTGNFLLFEK